MYSYSINKERRVNSMSLNYLDPDKESVTPDPEDLTSWDDEDDGDWDIDDWD